MRQIPERIVFRRSKCACWCRATAQGMASSTYQGSTGWRERFLLSTSLTIIPMAFGTTYCLRQLSFTSGKLGPRRHHGFTQRELTPPHNSLSPGTTRPVTPPRVYTEVTQSPSTNGSGPTAGIRQRYTAQPTPTHHPAVKPSRARPRRFVKVGPMS